jgi:hypothetical protein
MLRLSRTRARQHAWNVALGSDVSALMRGCSLVRYAITAILFGAASGGAQVTPPPAAPAHADTVAHRLSIDATRIQAAQFVYRFTLLRDTVPSPIGDQHFVITMVDYAGTPALMLARDGAQGVAAMTDSLVVRRDDLRPLHWLGIHGVARVAVEFTTDSIFGAMTSPLGKQNVVIGNRGDLLVNLMAVDVIVGAVPLGAEWRDSATVLVVDAGGAAVAPATLAVEGEEQVTVPAGDFDCWIVSLETERGSERLWVTKLGQVVVRSEQVLPELGGATLSRVLVQTDSPSLMPASARLPH